MMYFDNTRNNASSNGNSRCLDGALSSSLEMPYFNVINHSNGYCEYESKWIRIEYEVPSYFYVDYQNDIFIGQYGAVANAYRLVNLTQKEIKDTVEAIISREQKKHPDYNYVMVEDSFPVNIQGGKYGMSYLDISASMSSHVLYITDYQKHIKHKTRIRLQ